MTFLHQGPGEVFRKRHREIFDYSTAPSVSLVPSQCKVKKGSTILAKLTMSLTPPAGLCLYFLDLPLNHAAHTVEGTSQETTVGFASVPCLGNFHTAHSFPS